MKKFCFVMLDSINRTPYIWKYINAADYKYDIILWDRGRNSDSCGAEKCYYYYTKASAPGGISKAKKMAAYFGFSKYCNKILKKNNYDGVFVFAANTACLTEKTLMKHYSGKFILDFRDYWLEKYRLLYRIEERLLSKCYSAVISSRAYERFLPPYDYYMSHNSQFIDEETAQSFRLRNKSNDKIVIACIGGIKKIDYDKKVIDYFGNDRRFEIRYIGRGYDALSGYCEEKKYANIHIEGEFPIEKTMEKYEGVDIVLNMYGNHTPKLDYALSNKLYFSAQLGMPILVCPDTYMAETVNKYGTGFVIDIQNPADKDSLYENYMNTDWKEFFKKCDSLLKKTEDDEEKFKELIRIFTAE